jgi:ABC-2 type transport system ATP-binding protein
MSTITGESPPSTAGIRLNGLVKTFRGPDGPIRAVRGVDVEIAAGETVALLGPNGAGKSTTIDMLLGLLAPDEGSVSVFGHAPAEAVARGAVGGMLQTGELIRDLTVGELVAMMASLYPSPLRVEEALELSGVRDIATQGKTVVFATHYLEEADAYADRAVLMAHGAVVADGPPTEIRARVGTRTIRATLPGVEASELLGLPGVSSAERRGEAVGLRCTDSDAAIRALLSSYPDARDIEIAAAGLEEAFLALTGDRHAADEPAAASGSSHGGER